MADLKGGQGMDSRLEAMAQRASDATEVQVGWFEDATYPDGDYVAMVAALNEFGWKHAPPRPFFRRMIAAGEKHWGPDLGKLLQASNFDAKQSLGQMGLSMEGELQASIHAGGFAPLKPATIAAKGFATQLIDSSRMVNSVASKVV
jgi:hypothetical protein